MERRLLMLLAETSVHAGGPDSVALVDLPIQREATTRLPVIWGQSLKGALRQAARDAGWSEPEITAVFGSPPPRRPEAGSAPNDGSAAAPGEGAATAGKGQGAAGEGAAAGGPGGDLVKGAVSVGDAQLVALPAATLRNTFAWVTGPLQLNRVRRKIGLAGVADSAALAVSAGDGQAAGTSGWAGRQVFGGFIETVLDRPEAGRVGTALGELACPAEPAFDYTRQKMSTDLVCVEDTLLASLSQLGTDIVARVQLETATKTVAHGPFYSEHLPPETVLAAVLAGEPRHLDRLYTLLDGKPLQLGGDETVGKGLLWCRVHAAEELRGVLGRAADPGEPAPAPARPNPPGAARPTPADLARRNRG